MKNRATRRAHESAFRKELKLAVFDEFEDITQEALSSGAKFPSGMGKLIGFYKNSIYSVQEYFRDGIYLLGIRRHDKKPSCPWKHKQIIKNTILGEGMTAIEVFPPIDKLTDSANMYWLWSSEDISKLVKNLGGIGGVK